jgi:hypothetical protein
VVFPDLLADADADADAFFFVGIIVEWIGFLVDVVSLFFIFHFNFIYLSREIYISRDIYISLAI